jgi:hypothetical protein
MSFELRQVEIGTAALVDESSGIVEESKTEIE